MAKIVSFSLNDSILKQLDAAQNEMGFAGRSDAARAAIRLLVAEHQARKKMGGPSRVVLVVVHQEKGENEIAAIRHKYARYIKTQLHDHLEAHECVELFMLEGEGKELAKIAEAFTTAKNVTKATLVPL